MDYRLGYVSNCLTIGLTASHTTRLSHATPKSLEALIAWNLAELEEILLFNEAHGIQMFRIGSSLVPFASHPINTLPWRRTFARDFAAIGRIALRSGQRLSLHPSPAGASLASVRDGVREAARVELRYATHVLDLLGQDENARVIVHVGGAAPDRPIALLAAHRFLETADEDVRRRLTIEHDDYVWSAREVLPLADAHDVPFLADNLHNEVLPSDPPMPLEELLQASADSFRALGLRPKFHLASQAKGGRNGAHADFILPDDAARVIDALPCPVDLMLEAKEKDRALFALRQNASFRPERLLEVDREGPGAEGAR